MGPDCTALAAPVKAVDERLADWHNAGRGTIRGRELRPVTKRWLALAAGLTCGVCGALLVAARGQESSQAAITDPADAASRGEQGLDLGDAPNALAPTSRPAHTAPALSAFVPLGPGLPPGTPRLRFAPAPGEFRGAWLHWQDFRSADAIARTVARARAIGLNVLLPLANYPDQAMWQSRLLPLNHDVAPGFDPLRELVRQAHAAGIQVHPYLIMLNGGLTKHPSIQPDWYAVRRDGQRADGWLNPSHPGVRRFLSALAADLAQTGADGVMYDYIRWDSGGDYDYSEATRRACQAETGIDPLTITGAPADWPRRRAWNAWRVAQVTELVRQCSAAARAVRPDIIISTSGGTRREDLDDVHRDARTWLDRGYVDFVCPMAYTTDNEIFRQRLRTELEPVADPRLRQTIFAGIAAYKLESDAEKVIQQVQIARDSGLRGECLFAFECLTETMVAKLAAGPFRRPARVPWTLRPAS
jgi:uncharacterized lipoprotein YddW (UPF0748 family)